MSTESTVPTYKRSLPSESVCSEHRMLHELADVRDIELQQAGTARLYTKSSVTQADQLERFHALASTTRRVQSIAPMLAAEYPQYTMTLQTTTERGQVERHDLPPTDGVRARVQPDSSVAPAPRPTSSYTLIIYGPLPGKPELTAWFSKPPDTEWQMSLQDYRFDVLGSLQDILHRARSSWPDSEALGKVWTPQEWTALLTVQTADVVARTIMEQWELPRKSLKVSFIDRYNQLEVNGSDADGWTVSKWTGIF